MRKVFVVLITLAVSCAAVYAQSSASNKAYFASDSDGVIFSSFDQACTPPTGLTPAQPGSVCSAWIDVFNVSDVIKTSNNGALEAAVSMECALWTYNTVTASTGGGKKTSSSRAGIEVVVLIDGGKATPAEVVFCDRVQATGLEVTCTGECYGTDTITLDLFQRTKNANSFHFFKGPLGPILHDVQVKARGIVQCFANGTPIECPSGTLDAYTDAQTTAVIGKATLALEEHNNWGASP